MPGSIRAVALLSAALFSVSAAAQDGDERADDAGLDRTPQSCIVASRIDRTEVIDDNTIIFHMRGRNQAYANYLPRRCPNLAREDRFTYQRRSGQLCDDTTITVLELYAPGLGFTCQIGQFHPVTPEEVDEMRRIAERGGRDDSIDVEEVAPADEANDGGNRRRRNRDRRDDRD